MNEKRSEILVGAAVLAVAVGFLIFLLQSTSVGGGDRYALTASFRSAEGVTVGTDVRLAGVKIGSVASISLDPQTYRAKTEMSINSDIQVPDDSAIIVASEGLLGGSYIEIQPGGSPFYVEQGGEIEDTQSAVSLVSLLLKFVTGGE
ncbi:MAG: outer membrane lipid asymmetry maintenance protein MlaD [Paracoccaceae bacterium]|jgi:phospholipid/cholesterol/gamma-HCH transport system substrate-binding protein|nr:outer membrane lipid asymmetry maintenance protein MlaD [Paracoccaceae bacterium]MDP7186634.1 outer membrane lipid asymmetry maintenance protein MlaD [Paracoccaceae bacterium]